MYLYELFGTRLNVAIGEYAGAFDIARDVLEHLCFGWDCLVYAELVEAAVRSGRRETAKEAAHLWNIYAKLGVNSRRELPGPTRGARVPRPLAAARIPRK
jgi:hypothetical protein